MENNFGNANTIRKREKFITTGCPAFDEFLQGGFPTRGITQIYGAAGTGKSQLAMQLCLTVQLPEAEGGLLGGAVYICTESIFPSRRFQELMKKLNATSKHGIDGDAVIVEHTPTIEEFEKCVMQIVPLIMCVQEIRLIIIDSIAALYRLEEWNDEANERAKSLRKVGEQLHELSEDNAAILCINQVTTAVHANVLNDNSVERPALGSTWSSMVTNSIHFYRKNNARYAHVKLSSYIPEKVIQFEILDSGVRAIGCE